MPHEPQAAPERLTGDAALAWGALTRTLLQVRPLQDADYLAIEAAAKAWARWRRLEDELERLARNNPLAGEVSTGKNGLQESPLRSAARAAQAEYADISRRLGVEERIDLSAIDIFGYPDRPGRGQKGRPRFVPSIRDRNKVRLLLAVGWANPRIAAALEVSLPTFRRAFKKELAERDVMKDRLDARRLELAMEQANAGNITALRELGRLLERMDILLADDRIRADQQDEARPERLGKKEAALQAAREAAEEGEDAVWGADLKPGFAH